MRAPLVMPDLGTGLIRRGYGAIDGDRDRRAGGRSYVSRLLGRRAVVVGGVEGARLFYDEDVVERAGAMPPPLAWLLFGRGAIHGLDDQVHRDRKQLFLDVLDPTTVRPCAEAAGHLLEQLLTGHRADPPGSDFSVFPALVSAYGRAVLDWAGVDLSGDVAEKLSRDYATIVDGMSPRS